MGMHILPEGSPRVTPPERCGHFECPARGFFGWKIQCPTVDAVLCENCAIAESCLLEVSWGMKSTRDVGVDISDLLCPKLFVYMCCDATHAPCCQAWLFEVVFGMLHMHWRMNKVSYRACGERIRLTTMRSHGTPDTFFSDP